MKQFVLVYKDDKYFENMQKSMAMPAEARQAEMGKWMSWGEKCGDKLVNWGAPYSASKSIAASGVSAGRTDTGGYTVIQAEDMDAALDLVKNHPHLENEGCTIDVYETIDMTGANA